LYIWIPKGFFPTQDTGVIQAVTQADESVSFKAMSDRQQAAVDLILRDPDVDGLSSFIGVDGTNATLNSGRIQINLKPHGERQASAPTIINRLQAQLSHLEGITLYMQPVQDLTIEDRVSRTQYHFTLQNPDQEVLGLWTRRLVEALGHAPSLQE